MLLQSGSLHDCPLNRVVGEPQGISALLWPSEGAGPPSMVDCVANAIDSGSALGNGDFVGCTSGASIPYCRTCSDLANGSMLDCACPVAQGTCR